MYYGNIKEIKTQNFNRSNAGWDYANVQYRSYYTLFDLMSDEIIDGGFYYSTNEYATSYGYSQIIQKWSISLKQYGVINYGILHLGAQERILLEHQS